MHKAFPTCCAEIYIGNSIVDPDVICSSSRYPGGGGIKLVGVPQPKPMHRFSPNFQDIFTPRGSRAD